MKLTVVPKGTSAPDRDEALAEAEKFLREQSGKFTNVGEHPTHRVKITKPFYIGATEVTIRQFRMFVEAEDYKTDAAKGDKGGWGWSVEEQRLVQKPEFDWQSWGFKPGDDHPVVNVSFNDATAFCAWLSAKEEKTYRRADGSRMGIRLSCGQRHAVLQWRRRRRAVEDRQCAWLQSRARI
jgi:formylglycine-generating enzyme required for sulfatase activity